MGAILLLRGNNRIALVSVSRYYLSLESLKIRLRLFYVGVAGVFTIYLQFKQRDWLVFTFKKKTLDGLTILVTIAF